MPRTYNRHIDSLAMLTSKIDVPDGDIGVSISKRTLRDTTAEPTVTDIADEQDWHIPIIKELARPSSTLNIKSLKDFMIINEVLYDRGNDGILARALSAAEANEELQHIHELSSGINDISL